VRTVVIAIAIVIVVVTSAPTTRTRGLDRDGKYFPRFAGTLAFDNSLLLVGCVWGEGRKNGRDGRGLGCQKTSSYCLRAQGVRTNLMEYVIPKAPKHELRVG
jgi:hypothetical protein